jgi:hypothetical protein
MVQARHLEREAMAITLLAALSVYVLALLSPAIFNDGDTYWHISVGEWMLAHRAVLDHDVFSRTLFGKPWTTGEWLSEVLMAVSWRFAGWSGIAILTGLAMAAAVIRLGFYLGRRLDPLPCLVALVLAIACVMPDYLARPHILALPCLTVWIIGLADAASTRRHPAWWLLPVMAIWANLHGSFVFGLALMIPMAIEAAQNGDKDRASILRGWILFAVAAVAATLVNPHGFSGLVYPFNLLRVQSLAHVGEWQALDLRAFSPVEFSALATAFFFLWRGIRVPPVRLLLLIALFHQSLVHARYGLLLGIVAPVLLADSLAEATTSRERRPANLRWFNAVALTAAAAAALLVFSGVLRIVFPIDRTEGPASPIPALRAVPASLADQPVFNDYAFGGYLIFHGVKPLVDSRADFYGDAYLADYAKVVSGDAGAVERIFRKYRVSWTLLAPTDPLVALMDRRPGWHRLFTGRYAVVHAGPAVMTADIRPIVTSTRNLNPPAR